MGVFRQFPYSNFHEMNMDEIIKIVKNMLEEWAQYYAEWDAWMNQMNDDWSNYQEVMNEAWQNMQDFINNYFDNLDVQNEINNKITSMVNSGEFANIVEPYIPPRVTAWLAEHITQPVGVVIDTSLSVAGACADAKATGDAIENVKIDYISKTEGIIADAQTENLIIADAIRYGEYYNANGIVEPSASWWRTHLIPVTPSTSYSAGSCRILFFDNDGLYISDYNAWGGATFNTPANCAYIAVSTNIVYTSVYLYLTIETPPSWVKGEKLITIAKIKNFANEIQTTGKKFFPNYGPGKNLIDASGVHMDVVSGYYYTYDTGIKTAVTGMNYIVFPIEPNTNYVINAENIHIAFFSNEPLYSGTYVGGFLANSSNGYTWTTPVGASFMTVSFGNSQKPTIQMEYGTVSTPYQPFIWGVNGNEMLDGSIPITKLTEALQNKIGNSVSIGVGKDYSSILDAMINCDENTTFFVDAGTYDIINEYTSIYGDNYFVDYNGYAGTGNVFDAGLYLKKGCQLIGKGEVNIIFNYSGTNTKVKNFFAPLNTTSDNVVENINIKITTDSCRYIIHDDFASSPGANVFRNLILEGDSHLQTAMGCGMGTANTYIIENCYINSGDNANGISIAYHNNVASGAKNKLIIKDCYCNRGIRGGMYGASTEKSKMIVSGCKATSITNILTDPDNYSNQNIELIQWNNETA